MKLLYRNSTCDS